MDQDQGHAAPLAGSGRILLRPGAWPAWSWSLQVCRVANERRWKRRVWIGMFWGQGGGERRRRHEKSVSLRQGERCRPPLATNDLSGPAASSPILCLPSCHRSQGPVALAAHCSTSFFSSLGANTSHLHLQATTGKVRMQTARVQVDSRRPASPVSQAVAVLAGYRKGGRRDGGREATPLGKGGEPGSGSGSGSVAAADT